MKKQYVESDAIILLFIMWSGQVRSVSGSRNTATDKL